MGDGNASTTQWHKLLDLIGNDRAMINDFDNRLNGRVNLQNKWRDVAAILNKLPGGVKSVEKWREAFGNFKKRARKAHAQKIALSIESGRHSPIPLEDLGISEVYTRCLAVIGVEDREPHKEVPNPLKIQMQGNKGVKRSNTAPGQGRERVNPIAERPYDPDHNANRYVTGPRHTGHPDSGPPRSLGHEGASVSCDRESHASNRDGQGQGSSKDGHGYRGCDDRYNRNSPDGYNRSASAYGRGSPGPHLGGYRSTSTYDKQRQPIPQHHYPLDDNPQTPRRDDRQHGTLFNVQEKENNSWNSPPQFTRAYKPLHTPPHWGNVSYSPARKKLHMGGTDRQQPMQSVTGSMHGLHLSKGDLPSSDDFLQLRETLDVLRATLSGTIESTDNLKTAVQGNQEQMESLKLQLAECTSSLKAADTAEQHFAAAVKENTAVLKEVKVILAHMVEAVNLNTRLFQGVFIIGQPQDNPVPEDNVLAMGNPNQVDGIQFVLADNEQGRLNP